MIKPDNLLLSTARFSGYNLEKCTGWLNLEKMPGWIIFPKRQQRQQHCQKYEAACSFAQPKIKWEKKSSDPIGIFMDALPDGHYY